MWMRRGQGPVVMATRAATAGDGAELGAMEAVAVVGDARRVCAQQVACLGTSWYLPAHHDCKACASAMTSTSTSTRFELRIMQPEHMTKSVRGMRLRLWRQVESRGSKHVLPELWRKPKSMPRRSHKSEGHHASRAT